MEVSLMEVMYDRCCGIDVHKKLIVACFKCGKEQEIRKIGTTSDEIRELSKLLLDGKCQMIAMESTGSYWKPLYNIFELLGLDVIVANARDIKNVPGRKTRRSSHRGTCQPAGSREIAVEGRCHREGNERLPHPHGESAHPQGCRPYR